MERIFKYYPEDFGKLPVKVIHMDLDFDVYDEHTDVLSTIRLEAKTDIEKLSLNAKNLEIHEVTSSLPISGHEYRKEDNMLDISFASVIRKGTEFSVTTKTTCRPTHNILEGLYYDETPSGAPPQQITQCQQWGFQRIVPCFDDMTAKCTYITKITADARYTNIITNGDLKVGPIIKDGRKTVVYHNTITPMAPYLFFLGVGTYETFERVFEYPDGDTFMLELLVPPGSDRIAAERALEILHDGVMWIHLFTGKDTVRNRNISKKIWEKIQEREKERRDGKDLESIRKEIKDLSSGVNFGYKYTGTVYREIGMQNSDFGGMENVGNTTITTNRIMPFSDITDGSFEYMMRVKTHEFYHNLNGSEVTGKSPFEIWLNEAVTVFIERDYHAFFYGKDYQRLQSVQGIISPDGGTLLSDSGAASMPIEPDGFNDPNELITGITYVKAPEFVRMISLLMGDDNFFRALDRYHTKYAHSNATGKQWLECMEEYSDYDFKDIAKGWLKNTAYPVLEVSHKLDSSKLILKFSHCGRWKYPVDIAVFDSEGNKVYKELLFMDTREKTLDIEVPDFGFCSVARGYSFYGKLSYPQSDDELKLQLKHDDDMVNRYMAFYKIMDKEKMKLLTTESDVDDDIVDLYLGLFMDSGLIEQSGGQILMIPESVEDERYAHRYQALYDAKKRIMTKIAHKHSEEFMKKYWYYSGLNDPSEDIDGYVARQVKNIMNRRMKNLCLAILAKLDTPEIHSMIKDQFNNPTSATDRAVALSLYLDSSADDKIDLLKSYEPVARKSLVSWEVFLHIVSSADTPEVYDLISEIESSENFRIDQTNDHRALYGGFCHNKKISLQTEKGRRFVRNRLIKLAKINEYSTVRLLGIFSHIDKMEKKYHKPLKKVLEDIMSSVTEESHPSVYNTIKRMLANLNIN